MIPRPSPSSPVNDTAGVGLTVAATDATVPADMFRDGAAGEAQFASEHTP